MHTIKEVAAAAGVSIGSVSNVINGKTRNVDLIRRVEKAIRDLSYRPDANARSLKNTRSELVGVILPDIVHPGYSILLSSMEARLRERGYGVLLKISRNNRDVERQCVEQCLEKRVDGLIVHTPVDMTRLAETVGSGTPTLCITHGSGADSRIHRLRIDYARAFNDALDNLERLGIRTIGAVVDREMLAGGGMDGIRSEAFGGQNGKYVRIVDRSRERGFKAACELMFSHPEIESVIAGGPLIAEGVAKALEVLGRTEIPVTAVKDGNWIEDDGGFSSFISISHDAIAAGAVDHLLSVIEGAPSTEPPPIPARYEPVPSLTGGVSRHSGRLHFAMFECPAARALVMLSRAYSRQSGVSVSFDVMPYAELEGLLYGGGHVGRHDCCMFDVVWLPDLAESGALLPLEEYHGMATPMNSGFLDDTVEQYCAHENILYGLPFMSGEEFLYYQKNLFEDAKIARLYERLNGAELRPPATWEEFNTVARFFTKSHNRESPVDFGLATVSGRNIFTPVVFLPYLWSFGGELFDADGNASIDSPESLAALRCFLDSLSYSGDVAAHTWEDVVLRFQTGRYAMSILYDSHAVSLTDYTESAVAGNIGWATIPGGVSVLGGWSLGLSPETGNRSAALEFIRWATGDQSAVPLSLLGGSPLRASSFEREDIRRIYPWKALTGQSHARSRTRALPDGFAGVVPQSRAYVDILAAGITRCVNGKATPEKTLAEIENKLAALSRKVRGK